MTKGHITNMAASVRQRLLNVSKATNRRYTDVLQRYALERWLFRVSQTKYRQHCFLKGALLFVAWNLPATRPTRDIDLLARLSNDLENIRAVIAEICEVSGIDDGLVFDSTSVETKRIAETALYEGVRATFAGTLGTARIAMQVDLGFSDIITPAPVSISFPAILDHPKASLLAYNRESAIAEKFEAMVKLGSLNSRMKDFFDIALLAFTFDFEESQLAAAVRATFEHRGTRLEVNPICFSTPFEQDPAKAAQWIAFVKRLQTDRPPIDFPAVVTKVRTFLRPLVERMVNNEPAEQSWPAGGPWTRSGT